MVTGLFEGAPRWSLVVAAIVVTLLLAWLAARVARRLSAAVLAAAVRDTLSPASPLVRGPLRLVSLAAFVLVVAIVLFPALELAGAQPRAGLHLSTLRDWAFGPGLRVVLILVLAYALVRMTALVVRRFEH